MDRPEADQAQVGRPSRKRKAPASFADLQAIELYERKSKRPRVDVPAVPVPVPAAPDRKEVVVPPAALPAPAPEVREEKKARPARLPPPPARFDSYDDLKWSSQLIHVDRAEFEHPDGPEIVSFLPLVFFVLFWPLPLFALCLVISD